VDVHHDIQRNTLRCNLREKSMSLQPRFLYQQH